MIKPIETIYNGYKFRSRLEARWAVFFDTLYIKYEYEKEGFDIDGIWYLPDFYLPDYSCWVEIKPDSFVFGSDAKINAFAKATKDKFLLICGIPKIDRDYFLKDNAEYARYTVRLLSIGKMYDHWEMDYYWEQEYLDPLYVFALARRAIAPELCLLQNYDEWWSYRLIDISTDDGEREPVLCGLEKAYEAATQARFEFLEERI